MRRITGKLIVLLLLLMEQGLCLGSLLNLGPEQLVQVGVTDRTDIEVDGYSVPSYVDWNNDGRKDLVVGEGGGGYINGKVRVYLNNGTASEPQFSSYFYAQSDGSDLVVTGEGCLGAFPRLLYWDSDGRRDLLVGLSDGTTRIYLNTGTNENPTFDAGTTLQVGPPGSEGDIDVGDRTAPTVVDWDNDGLKDLVAGALDGKIHLFINEGTDTTPDFLAETIVQDGISDLVVFGTRSSPVILDLDGDGKKDLLTGNTYGQLLLYVNTGTDAAPAFSDYSFVDSDGTPIDLSGLARSRPFVCDWTGDGYLDVLIGAGDGKVHLYEGIPEPATIVLLGVGGVLLLRKRRA
jgi:hypothetical protein